MLNRIILLLPFLGLVANMPQEIPFALTFGGKQYIAKLDKGYVAPATPSNECDGFSCNGKEYKVITEADDFSLGQCQINLPDDEEGFWCFVDENSSCEKTPMDEFQGQYISTQACKADNAPKKRYIGGIPWGLIIRGVVGCLLGGTQILMADYSTKSIEDLKPGQLILDGHLQPVEVVDVFSNFVGDNQLYQFAPNGPVFTEDHQFISNLEQGQVGVVSKSGALSLNPNLDESKIHNLKDLYSLLQLKDGNIIKAGFNVVSYKTMDPSTPTYFIITTGRDGSYIADNFVSKDVLPDFEKWPLTYATLGHIVTSCKTDYAIDTYRAVDRLGRETGVLANNWRVAISDLDNLESLDDYVFDQSAWIKLGQQEILGDKEKMRFAQLLNANGAKLLSQVLDDNTIPLGKRHALVQKIKDITQQSLSCNFVVLP